MQFAFIESQVDGYRNTLKLSCRPFAFLKKWKEVWNWSLYLIFCIIFEEKYLSCYWQSFIVRLVLLREILDNMCIAITCPKSHDKNLKERKELLRWNKKHSYHFQFLGRWESEFKGNAKLIGLMQTFLIEHIFSFV